MCALLITKLCDKWEGWNPLNQFNHTSLVAVDTPTDRRKSVRNRCVIEVFGGVSVLSLCFFEFSVGKGVFVIGLSQISSFSLKATVTLYVLFALNVPRKVT